MSTRAIFVGIATSAILSLASCATAPTLEQQASIERDCAVLSIVGKGSPGDGDTRKTFALAETIALRPLKPQPKCPFQRSDLGVAIGYSPDNRYAAVLKAYGFQDWICVVERKEGDWSLVGCGVRSEADIAAR